MTAPGDVLRDAYAITYEGAAATARERDLARLLLHRDSAFDAVTGDIHLLDSRQQTPSQTLAGIRDTLDRPYCAGHTHEQGS